ncbi:MAG: NmrA family NAD(P)-binding protein [Solirubrobacteraceae bacterium]|nr:NmrA family NAD(P)-binding protein [Solirubrobacteraceae bacterium]
MTDILILGGTGKTGRRLATILRDQGHSVRTAARSGADVSFDWDDPASRTAALQGADRVYLVPPALRLDHAPLVGAFLDEAVAAGVRHVTFLSAGGVQFAPPEAALRAIELMLVGRDDITHTILRPSWFLQNLTEGFMAPMIAEGTLALPAGDGAEAFIDAEDIAAVAAATLVDPAAHAGREYNLTGPEAITHAELAARISAATGREVRYVDADRAAWIEGVQGAGVPADYAELLAGLFDVIRDGHGSRPTGDVEAVLGRRARGVEAFVTAAAASAAWGPSATPA